MHKSDLNKGTKMVIFCTKKNVGFCLPYIISNSFMFGHGLVFMKGVILLMNLNHTLDTEKQHFCWGFRSKWKPITTKWDLHSFCENIARKIL